MGPVLTLLHTSPAHVAAFDALRDRDHPGLPLRHVVAEPLLAQARAQGVASVRDALDRALAEAVAAGADAVLCTCSTIGGLAEARAAAAGIPVLRVDRPMAAAAVAVPPRAGHQAVRIALVAALADTLGPTRELIAEEAARAGRQVEVADFVAEGAWALFEAGEQDAYLAAVAKAVDAVRDAEVVVLAQASMAQAAALATTPLPVLSSPALGLTAAVAAGRQDLRYGRSTALRALPGA
ncbi:Aspartate/glutamate racemase [Actinacidiphila guanduensis]|uniref:Aspartate/glutamate racemase n=1 Tax=Actinacidiphila guanduensis TaxID=310781 RepID=A0A1H0MZI2_9ACTN|nr:aspartate/glutamate racemase family protein [Actinacidiphila guanduensis]SDO85781.1 Aspartate/glutamate racemase [Actinacidiphila guanduensis]